jgi:uncharacterized membrane protein YciS (DUF1049 family)
VKDILVVLLVIALALLVVGAANDTRHVDVNYLFGTWHGVSLFVLIAIAAAALVVVGLVVLIFAAIRGAGERRKLERELERTYARLRETEARLAQVEATATGAASASSTSVAGEAPDEARPSGGDPAVGAGEVGAAAPPASEMTATVAGPTPSLDGIVAPAGDDAAATAAGPLAASNDRTLAASDDRTVALDDKQRRDDV